MSSQSDMPDDFYDFLLNQANESARLAIGRFAVAGIHAFLDDLAENPDCSKLEGFAGYCAIMAREPIEPLKSALIVPSLLAVAAEAIQQLAKARGTSIDEVMADCVDAILA